MSGNHIGHHSVIRDHAFISSHVVVSGRVEIGEQCFVGVNATLRDHIRLELKVLWCRCPYSLRCCQRWSLHRLLYRTFKGSKFKVKGNLKPTWQKLGLIYAPEANGRHAKLLSYVANPLPVHINDDIYRIFYCGRDTENRSSVGAVDVDILQRRIIADHPLPFFENGSKESFFSDGISIGNCYEVKGVRYITFMGWKIMLGNIGE